jgi:hypothetical protein
MAIQCNNFFRRQLSDSKNETYLNFKSDLIDNSQLENDSKYFNKEYDKVQEGLISEYCPIFILYDSMGTNISNTTKTKK